MDFRLENSVIADKYVVKSKIGSGSFGEIYQGYIRNTSCTRVAIKFEKVEKENDQTLRQEAKILQKLRGKPNFPTLYHFSHHRDYYTMIMTLLGSNLESLFRDCKRRFSFKTVAMLGIKMVDICQQLHSMNFIHRDIKPENWVVGSSSQSNRIFMIDFGLSKRFADDTTKVHIPYREGKGMIGTPRYASLNAHLGNEQGRRDDLESIGYILIYFAKRKLPWQDLKGTREKKMETVKKMKEDPKMAGAMNELPVHFSEFMKTVKKTAFSEEPNYDYLKLIFDSLLKSLGTRLDDEFDWLLTVTERDQLLEGEKEKYSELMKVNANNWEIGASKLGEEEEKNRRAPSLIDGAIGPTNQSKMSIGSQLATDGIETKQNGETKRKSGLALNEVGESGNFLDVPKSTSFLNIPCPGLHSENSSNDISMRAIRHMSEGPFISSELIINSFSELGDDQVLREEDFPLEFTREINPGEVPVFLKVKHLKAVIF